MRLGVEAADVVSKEFITPIKLEFEKVYWPYLLMNKKRYAGLYWTKPDKWDKIDTKGIETVRRDNCLLVKNVITEALDTILIERSPQKAIDNVKKYVSELLCNRLDLSLLVISKSLGKGASSEDYAAKQAHVELAERMRKRDPTSAPSVGDRVPYVIVRAAKGAANYEKSEDPIWVLEHDLPIDTDYYLEHQLKKPLERLFEPILGERAVQQLFEGDHTLKVKISTGSGGGGIMKFAKKTETCLGCRVALPAGRRVLCTKCEPRRAQLYLERMNRAREHEDAFGQLWAQCQRCQASIHSEVLCTSRDCPIFYRRKKVQIDLNEALATVDRFAMD
jgi:DNA polymerase delta subunit 1